MYVFYLEMSTINRKRLTEIKVVFSHHRVCIKAASDIG